MRIPGRLTLLTIVMLLHSAPGWSLGLGDARVQSFIGQPLEIHIDLLTSPGDDLESVTARLATAEDFALIGASREAISVPLRFMVQEGSGAMGSHILVTSRLAVDDPVLRLVVEVNWSSGRLLREYTVFLDPPTVAAQAPAPVVSPPESQTQVVSEPVQQQPQRASEYTDRPPPPPAVAEQAEEPRAESPAPASTAPESVAQAESTDEEAAEAPLAAEEETVAEAEIPDETPDSDRGISAGVYGPVQSGETLWRIATNYMGESRMDMNQVMVAIQRKNPQAFLNENINLLKRGAVLEMPTEGEVNELSRAEARAMVAQHEAAFRMRSSLASTSTPLLASESQSRTETQAEDLPAPGAEASDQPAETPAEESVALLEIVPASDEDMASAEPGTGAVPGGEGSDEVTRNIREELARTEEALISAQQENTYLQERIAELETQIADSAGLSDGTVADEQLSDLEQRLEAQRLERQQEAASAEETRDQSVPRVTTLEEQDSTPWYSGRMTWIIMVIIVVAAVIGWLFNRRRAAVEYDLDSGAQTVATGLKGEAEEILRTLDADASTDSDDLAETDDDQDFAAKSQEDPGDTQEPEQAADPAPAEAEPNDVKPEGDVVPLARARRKSQDDIADATVLDADSSDPEIKLDLARAYISMGDKEAARAILEEVLNMGNEQQQAEARSMMDEI